jgi:hypothetical protein
MPISFACPCGKPLRTRDGTEGRSAVCPACGAPLTVPGRPAARPPVVVPGSNAFFATEAQAEAPTAIVNPTGGAPARPAPYGEG